MRLGVIDIGYNAIRASVYQDNTLGAAEIFNNKFRNDILSLLEQENLGIKHQTYLCLQHIFHIFGKMNVSVIKCAATAALRNHPKASEFVLHIKKTYNVDIEIISGEKEASLSALGLITATPNANGIAVDLGGGSLELMEVKNKQIGKLKSLDLGTKVIASKNLADIEVLSDIIRTNYGTDNYDNLYLLGGALRFICRLYIEFSSYPINNLHNLTIARSHFLEYLDKLEHPSSIKKYSRQKLSHNAILIVRSLVDVFEPQNIIVSTFGLKEGIRLNTLSEEERNKDLILEKVLSISQYNQQTNFDSYYQILLPILPGGNNYFYLFKLALCLSYLQRNFDHTQPPLAITQYILSSEIPFLHKDRVMLALIQAHISNFKPDFTLSKIAKRLLSKKERAVCLILGHFIRIAKEIDGALFTSPSFSITLRDNFLEISSGDLLPRPIFEKVCDRLKSIAFARKMLSNNII